MKKKLTLIIAAVILMLSFAACGEDPRLVDYNGYSYDDLQRACQSTVSTLEELSGTQLQDYMANGSKETAELVTSWIKCRSDLGSFVGFGDFEVNKAGKTLTAEQTVYYEERPLILTYVFKYNTMEVTAITVDLVYTTAEKMSKAGLNTVMCITVVFAVLIVISLIISCFKLIAKAQKAMERKEEPEAKEALVEQVSEPEVQTDNSELVAVIAAAIAAATGTGTDGFIVRSIRRR